MANPTRPTAPDATASVAGAEVTAAPGASAGLPVPLAPGTRYVLGDEIARGGMGEVYRATDTVLGRNTVRHGTCAMRRVGVVCGDPPGSTP